jgi:hypothetical protein
MTKEELEELSNTIRKNIFELLELWSSKEEQLLYQKNVPIAQVSAELFCQWDDFYHPETDAHKLAFNQKERDLIEIFYIKLDLISKKTSGFLPYIDDYILTKDWIELNQLARETLAKMNLT